MNKENYIFIEPPTYDTLFINTNKVIIKDMELNIEIDLKDKIKQINKIIIDGIAFTKENKDE